MAEKVIRLERPKDKAWRTLPGELAGDRGVHFQMRSARALSSQAGVESHPGSAEQGDPWKEVCLSPAGPGVFHWSSALAKEGNMPCKIMLRQETLPGAKGYVKGPTGDTQPLEWCLEDQPRNSHTL